MNPPDPREVMDLARDHIRKGARLLDMLPDDALGVASSGTGEWASNWHKLPVHRRALSNLIQDIDTAREKATCA